MQDNTRKIINAGILVLTVISLVFLALNKAFQTLEGLSSSELGVVDFPGLNFLFTVIYIGALVVILIDDSFDRIKYFVLAVVIEPIIFFIYINWVYVPSVRELVEYQLSDFILNFIFLLFFGIYYWLLKDQNKAQSA